MSFFRSSIGQILGMSTVPRVPFDEDGDNGLLLGEKYLPEELIAEILCFVDYESLLNCQLVCKRWKALMHSYIWRKKAEMICGRSLKSLKNVPWQEYYTICKKKPFERNLLKNTCGQDGMEKHWRILRQGGDHWVIESPPVGVRPLPAEEPMFQGKQYCFATSYYNCSKIQTIKLASEGLTSHLLDKFQPPIVVSEWYSCRWDCPATYECSVKLISKKKKVLDTFEFLISIENDLQNQWHRVSHEFTNYGPGLEEITFYHGGKDNAFWAGHYGSKMSGASVIVKLPEADKPEHESRSGQSCNSESESETPRSDPQRRNRISSPIRRLLELD